MFESLNHQESYKFEKFAMIMSVLSMCSVCECSRCESFINNCCPGSSWNPETLLCERCMQGFTGESCSTLCPYPYYGVDCQMTCKCSNDSCDASKGCISLTTGSNTVSTEENHARNKKQQSNCLNNHNTKKACNPPFDKIANNCYYISRDQVEGDEAFARCINIGSYLANFETLEEAMLMKQKLRKMNSADACKPPFHKFGKSCYFISRDQVGGDEAFARCINIGGYLANFETLEEAMLMKQKLMKMNTGLHFFVGGRNINKRKPGGDWRWIKNGRMTEMSYFAFGGNEPNGFENNPQDCMFLYAHEYYRFHSVICDNYKGGYICEK